jgi:hypothetical protein
MMRSHQVMTCAASAVAALLHAWWDTGSTRVASAPMVRAVLAMPRRVRASRFLFLVKKTGESIPWSP